MKMNRLRVVEGAEAGEEAFEELLKFVRGKNLAAAESLDARKDGILAFRPFECCPSDVERDVFEHETYRERDAQCPAGGGQGLPVE